MKKLTIFKFQLVICKLVLAIFLSVCIIFSICVYHSFAEVPCKINYQGRLIKDNVPVDGTKKMKFSIYPDATGDSPIWTSGDVNITVYNGLFRYVLGEGVVEGKPVDDLSSIPWTAGETLYLEVKVENDILKPREAIYAYPYAINSHLLEGKTTDYFLNTSVEAQTKRGNLKIEGMLDIDAPDTDIDALRVHSGDTYGLYVSTSGNVGIGTTGPEAKLHVVGTTPDTGPGSSDILQKWSTQFIDPLKAKMTLSYKDLSPAPGGGTFIFDTEVPPLTPPRKLAFMGGNVGIGTTEPDATLDVDGTVSIFGDWTTTDSLGNTLVKDAIYKATTDGIVCATVMRTNNNAYINAYSGPSSSPSYPESVLTQGLPEGYSRYAAVTLPVKKDDYWRIYVLEGTPTIRWLPMGSGTCVRQ